MEEKMQEKWLMLRIDNRSKYPVSKIKRARIKYVTIIDYFMGCSVECYIKISLKEKGWWNWKTYVMSLWPDDMYFVWEQLQESMKNEN